MSSIKDAAQRFFDACETGKGWEVCGQYCHPGATFSAQAGALTGINTPTDKRVEADYVYVMQFDGDRIRHMTKIWNDAVSLQQLGWA